MSKEKQNETPFSKTPLELFDGTDNRRKKPEETEDGLRKEEKNERESAQRQEEEHESSAERREEDSQAVQETEGSTVEGEQPEAEEELEADASEQEEEREEEEFEAEVELDGNVLKPAAELYKRNGLLPDDFEITDDIDPDLLQEKLLETVDERRVQEIRAEVADELKKFGVDPNLAERNKMLSYGVTEDELKSYNAYSQLAQAKEVLDPEKEDFEDKVQQLGKAYFQAREIDGDDVENYVEADFNKYDTEELLNKYSTFFQKKSSTLKSSIGNKVEQGRKTAEQKKVEDRKRIEEALDSGKIDGREYTPDQTEYVRNFMLKKSEVVEDEHGNRKRVTPYEKKQIELQQNPEKALRAVVDFILGYDAEKLKEQGRTEGKRKFLNDLNKTTKIRVNKKESGKEKVKNHGPFSAEPLN